MARKKSKAKKTKRKLGYDWVAIENKLKEFEHTTPYVVKPGFNTYKVRAEEGHEATTFQVHANRSCGITLEYPQGTSAWDFDGEYFMSEDEARNLISALEAALEDCVVRDNE